MTSSGVGSFTDEPVCVMEDSWHDEKHYPVPQHLLVVSSGGAHPFCLKWIRFAITLPKSLLPHLGWGQCEQTQPQCMSLWVMPSPCQTQTELIFYTAAGFCCLCGCILLCQPCSLRRPMDGLPLLCSQPCPGGMSLKWDIP